MTGRSVEEHGRALKKAVGIISVLATKVKLSGPQLCVDCCDRGAADAAHVECVRWEKTWLLAQDALKFVKEWS